MATVKPHTTHSERTDELRWNDARTTCHVDGKDETNNEADDDIFPVTVVQSEASEAAQNGHHHQAESHERTKDSHLATAARHIVDVDLRSITVQMYNKYTPCKDTLYLWMRRNNLTLFV